MNVPDRASEKSRSSFMHEVVRGAADITPLHDNIKGVLQRGNATLSSDTVTLSYVHRCLGIARGVIPEVLNYIPYVKLCYWPVLHCPL